MNMEIVRQNVTTGETDGDYLTVSNSNQAQQSHLGVVRQLLRPLTKLDLIIGLNRLTGVFDIRDSIILDVNEEHIKARQTEPAITKSRKGHLLEVTAIHQDQECGATIRWGWPSKILEVDNEHRLNKADRYSGPIPIFYLSLPSRSCLRKINLRQSYRLEPGVFCGIVIELPGIYNQFQVLNFSAGGFLAGSGSPPPFYLGQEVPFKLIFPKTSDYAETSVHGLAQIVRLDYDCQTRQSKVGFKFLQLSSDTYRAMEKIINHYMLEEQRKRNRSERYCSF